MTEFYTREEQDDAFSKSVSIKVYILVKILEVLQIGIDRKVYSSIEMPEIEKLYTSINTGVSALLKQVRERRKKELPQTQQLLPPTQQTTPPPQMVQMVQNAPQFPPQQQMGTPQMVQGGQMGAPQDVKYQDIHQPPTVNMPPQLLPQKTREEKGGGSVENLRYSANV